jgi:hypothetical protein
VLAEAVAVAINPTQLVLLAVLVVVDQMVVLVVLELLDHLDRDMMVDLVNPQLLAVVVVQEPLVLMLLVQLPELVVLVYHIVLVALQNSMPVVAVVVIDNLLVEVVPQVVHL